ncbi:S-layer homology domain-containing protein [Paenibacillus catalpae]|uniref:S-layer homology domain-containing protein n=2 Tax=Paenibacillus catalpae TaxID=1045775 RepID=A0A1I2H6H9_9BACL|nr:S-layer homology domain-containing protein [Paenibacillus catalpae]
MKKSLISLALAGSMLSALAVPAFAATPSDVVGKPVQNAVEALTALGIINGYADGTFKPDNTITRAELAKIVITATGNASAANLMANTPPAFKDVKKGVWYTGYINAAAAKGFIQGYNGKFRPNDTIKFEEVTAILVRALGYKDKYLSGSWPYNVLLQADEVGLFSGVELAQGTNATRGVVAELTENALSENLVQYDADGNVSNVQAGTPKVDQYLINKLGTSATEVVKLSALTSDKKIAFVTGDVAVADNYFITGGKKLADLVGHSVSVLKNKDGKVIAITDAQAASNSITTTTNAAPATTTFERSTTASAKTFTIGGTTYTTSTDFVVYNNTDLDADFNLTVTGAKEVQIFKNSAGLVQAVLVNNWASNLVVSDIVAYSNYSRIVAKSGFSTKVDANTSITLNGKDATLADLKANDVINVIENAADSALKIVATRNVVTGKVEATGTESGSATVKVSGTTYKNVSGTVPTIGTEYSFLLNKDNEVVAYETPNAVTASAYAVIYSVEAGKSIIVDGEVQTGWTKVVYYSLKDQKVITAYTKDADTTNNAAALANTIVELGFTNGAIDLTAAQVSAAVDVVTDAAAVTADPTATKLTVGTTNYVLNNNTIYLKVGIDAADITKNTVANAKAADVAKNDVVAVKAKDGVAQYVIIKSKGAASTTLPQVQGVFVSQSAVTTADGTSYTVKLNVKGEEKTFAIGAAITGVAKNDIVTLQDTVTTNAVYDVTTPFNTEAATLTVNNSARTIVAGGTGYIVTGNTQVVLLKKSDGTISTGAFADVSAAADGTNYGVGSGQFKVIVQGTGDMYDSSTGDVEEAGVIVVVAY